MQARPSWHAPRRPSALLGAVLAVTALAAAATVAVPPAASAAVPAHGIVIHPDGHGPVRLGPLEGTAVSDEHGYCLQGRVLASGPADVPVGTDHVDDPVLAALLARHRFDADDLTQAAIGYAAHQRHERPGVLAGGDAVAARALIAAATPQQVKDRADALLAEAAASAGPFAGDAGAATGGGRRTGSITGIALRSASGQPVVGAPFTVTLSGPAVLDASGTRTYEGTTTADPVTLAWTATGTGDVGYRVEFADLWRTTITVLDLAGDRQDQLTYGNRPGSDPRQVVAPGPSFPVVDDFRPRATTTVQDALVADGDALVDRVAFSAAPGDWWVEVDGDPVDVPAEVTWYGPFDAPLPQSAEPPAGAPVAGTVRVVADGPGTVTTPGSVRATRAGFYTAVVTIRKADAGQFAKHVREDFRAPFFEAAETAVNLFDLRHESQTREFNVAPGGRAFDRITVSGYPADHGAFGGLGPWGADLGEATVTVYGPLPALPDGPEVPVGAPVHWQGTVAAVDGRYDVGYDPARPIVAPTTATHPGGDYFVFVYAFAGDSRVAPFVSAFDDLREVFYVPGDPEVVVPPQAVTRAQDSAVAGGMMRDTALVTGTTAPGDHLVFEAYGPQDPGAAPVCDASTLLWTSEAVEVRGAGYYDSGEAPAPARPGLVHWVETLVRADGTRLDRGECGAPAETTTVTEDLTVRTTARAEDEAPAAGTEVWDVLTVTGTVPDGALTTVDLFHARPGDDLVCRDPVWTTTVPLSDGAGEYRTGRYRTTGPGTYGFVERTTAPDGTELSAGRCGEESETLTVTAPTPTSTPAAPPAPGAAGPPPLAVTGADLATSGVAALLLVAGGVLALVHRSRVRRAVDAAT
ncbi:hypothetical protein [Cellulomonas sp. C5510]|uniref:hypothetical protein n=1 Tax=Cellulomonas sp. C5510 TaxID=2871170 RepID=UPI001C9409FE|nr:hypothetical protein [Cellulomonas sp. C5510]QZN86819.1 hypothetical protein K5O09_06810 [Cellulomonas sp. C5510]